MRLTIACCTLLGALAASGAHAAGDAELGKYKAQTCMGCHGTPNYTNTYPTYRVPKLGGQHPDYIISALRAYAGGQRSHKTMHANAASLSEQDMADIAAFFSSFK